MEDDSKFILPGSLSPIQLLELEKGEPKEIEQQRKNNEWKILKAKLIALDEMNKHPLHDPLKLSNRDKTKFVNSVNYIINNDTDESIDRRFNDICNDVLFTPDADISRYKVKQMS